MSRKSRSAFMPQQTWPAIAIVAIAALAYVASVEASRPTAYRAEATPVAVIDVARLVDEIDERSEWDIRIEALQASINQEGKSRQAAMERRLTESEAAPNDEQRQLIRDEVALMQLRLEQWAQIKTMELDRERALKWQSIYRNLRRESSRIAETEGYELIMVDDNRGEINTDPTNQQMSMEQQVLTQIMNRRILFAAEPIDITDQVIVRMNNATPQP